MNSMLYILVKSAKNSFKELLTKPAKLMLYLFLALILVAVIVMSLFTKRPPEQALPIMWLQGGLFLFLTLFVGIAIAKGCSGGDAIFDMNDVNFLFVAPLDTRKVLLYGIARMTKTAFTSSFFILFQIQTFAIFGVGVGGVWLVFGGFMLNILVLMAVSLLIYTLTNGNAKRQWLAKGIAASLFLPLAGFVMAQVLGTQDILAALAAACQSPFLRYIPVSGWTASGVVAFLSGSPAEGAGLFALNLLLGAAVLAFIFISNREYYEDVLVTTQTAYERKQARAEGNLIAIEATAGRAIKVRKTGLRGQGASALFAKHMREDFRQNWLGFVGPSTLWMGLVSFVLFYFVSDLSVALQVLFWVQIFLIGTGRGLKETYFHYIFLIPESSLKKIIWSNMEMMARTTVDALVIFGIGGVILRASLLDMVVNGLCFILFSFLLLGVNFAMMRGMETDVSQGLMIILYMIAVGVVMSPGLVAAAAVGALHGPIVGTAVLTGWELLAGLGCFALAQGVLHNCDMAQLKPNS